MTDVEELLLVSDADVQARWMSLSYDSRDDVDMTRTRQARDARNLGHVLTLNYDHHHSSTCLRNGTEYSIEHILVVCASGQ